MTLRGLIAVRPSGLLETWRTHPDPERRSCYRLRQALMDTVGNVPPVAPPQVLLKVAPRA